MRQAIMTEPGKIALRDVEKPAIKNNEVLLCIKRIGVCGSDIHVYHGKHPFTSYPIVQGHEYCGMVEQIGSEVKGVRVGQLATARPQLVCGDCGPCKRDDYNVCEKLRVQGFQAPGCAQDYFAVPEDRLVLFPDNLKLEQGALVEPVSVGCHSTWRAGNIAGQNVVVMGAGTIGNLIAQVAKARRAKRVLIVDVSEYRLKIAHQCQIQYISNAKQESFKEAVSRAFGGEGFQLAFEAAGAQECLSALVGSVEKGGRVIIVGVFEEPPAVDMSVVCEHEINVIGSMMYKHEDYLEAVRMISDGRVQTESLVTKSFPFEKYLDAYQYIDAQGDKTLKVMIEL